MITLLIISTLLILIRGLVKKTSYIIEIEDEKSKPE